MGATTAEGRAPGGSTTADHACGYVGKVGPRAEALGSVSTAALPQDAYAARRASMTTLSLAFRVLVRCPEQGLPAPDRSSPYRKSHLILPKQGRTRDPFTVQSILFRPQQKHPGSAQPATPGARSTPVRYPGQDASGGGAGYRPRVLKRYYESVVNLAATLRLCRQMVHRLEAGSPAIRAGRRRKPGRLARRGSRLASRGSDRGRDERS